MGGEGLRHAVDFIQKQDALMLAGGFHQVIDGGDDLAHVYSEMAYATPSYTVWEMNGRPSALWRVWCVME